MEKKKDKIKKRRVSLYFSENISSKEDIKNLFLEKHQESIELLQKGKQNIFYAIDSSFHPVDWIEFFKEITDISPAITSFKKPWGILFYLTPNNNCFAIAFGSGSYKLDKSQFIYNFGLKTTLNMINEDSIMHQTSKSFSQSKLRKDISSTNSRKLTELGFDTLTDILSNIDGEIKSEYKDLFQSKISGGQALNIPLSPSEIDEQLAAIESAYDKKDYRTNFKFIDNISPLIAGETKLKEELDLKIYEQLESGNFAVFSPLPSESYYSIKECFYKDKSILLTNPGFIDILSLSKKSPKQLLVFLKNNKITVNMALEDSSFSEEFSLYKFLSLDLKHEEQQYILENGMWFRLNINLIKEVDEFLESRKTIKPNDFFDVQLEDKERGERKWRSLQDEGDYLIDLSKKNPQYILGDRKLVDYTEVFDLLKDNVLFHIKKGTGGSAPLSHLFKQGVVSITRLKSEVSFEGKTKEKIPDFNLDLNSSTIAFGIIKNSEKLPIFSKISFKMDATKIENIIKEQVRLFFIKHETEENPKRLTSN